MIEAVGLRYRYPQGPALAFADLQVAQGATVLLTGPSGCGKSTWLALVAGLLRATSGSLTVADQKMGTLGKVANDAWRARTIGFLPQKLHLSGALCVADNLALAQWAAGFKRDDKAIQNALDSLGIGDLAQRKPHQLSGGQSLRVALARAVLLRPRLLLADEPTASLDDDSASAAISVLQTTAQRQGATLVIATHDSRVTALLAQSQAALSTLRLGPNTAMVQA
jgi:putative ABC transport system ATP-binding protein